MTGLDRRMWWRLAIEVAVILAVVTAFYAPTWWLQPNDPHRWDVWMLGYVCGLVVMIWQRRWLG